jgi:pyruvate dehydrogenase E1 component
LLHADFGVASDIYSVTSFSELAREANAVERHNRLHAAGQRNSYVAQCLPGKAPVIAATDYVRAYAQLIAPHIDARYVVLGTDGFGRSDTRAALREFFEVDRHHVAVAAIAALVSDGQLPNAKLAAAVTRYGLDVGRPAPWTV